MILFGPLGGVIALVMLVPSVGDDTLKGLLMLSLIWLFCSLLLTPAILFPDSGSPPPRSDGGDGGGGGGGGDPPERSPKPTVPRGGIPLPDAEQSRKRVRDHRRPAWRRLHPRRPAREPERAPTVPHR